RRSPKYASRLKLTPAPPPSGTARSVSPLRPASGSRSGARQPRVGACRSGGVPSPPRRRGGSRRATDCRSRAHARSPRAGPSPPRTSARPRGPPGDRERWASPSLRPARGRGPRTLHVLDAAAQAAFAEAHRHALADLHTLRPGEHLSRGEGGDRIASREASERTQAVEPRG